MRRPAVSVSYCCITSCPKPEWFKATTTSYCSRVQELARLNVASECGIGWNDLAHRGLSPRAVILHQRQGESEVGVGVFF